MLFVFGECVLDVDRRELRRAGTVRPLEPEAFLVLMHLLTQRQRAVSKDELLATCWPHEFVTEAALTRCLKVIRQAVADDGVRQHVIKTLRGYGYRFVAAVEERPTLPPASTARVPDSPLPRWRALAALHRPCMPPTGALLLRRSHPPALPTNSWQCAVLWKASANRSPCCVR
jgi:DNA-binding winged helix-turn-helix (wHTH) protein